MSNILGSKLESRVIVVVSPNKKIYSNVRITCGPITVAKKCLAGEWTPVQGLKEFKRNPKTFQPGGCLQLADLGAYALLPA